MIHEYLADLNQEQRHAVKHVYRDIDYLSHGSGPHSSGPGRATARNALRDWNSVPVRVEGKGGGFRNVRGVPLPCVTTVSTTSNLGLPRSVTSLGQSTSTLVLASPDDRTTAVCVLPGTELGFSEELQCAPAAFSFTSWRTKAVSFRTAIFRQVNKDVPRVHHDALEFPDGTSVLLTNLLEGQEATVLQLPAQPKTPAEEAAQRRVTYVG